ncbi:hypothetical protein BKA69DRAFT_1121392 [Paraphysoderma sedebokerense]|nr:hypothetical protein BKA69DRAFT_1121392 [Paraphysoderma sedebokerense]
MMSTDTATMNRPHTMGEYPIAAAQKMGQTVSAMTTGAMETTRSLKDRLTSFSYTTMDTIRLYMREYPLLRAFVYVMSLFSAIPVSIFATYATATFLGSLIVASIGVAVVEGGLLGFGFLVLLPFLGGSLLLTLMTLTGYYATLWTLRGVYYVLDVLRGAGGTTGHMAAKAERGMDKAAGMVSNITS